MAGCSPTGASNERRRLENAASKMSWRVFIPMALLPTFAQAQSCGPDTAPAQASAVGYNCETFRWSTGDTVSEIDTGHTFAPGFKWYENADAGNYLGSYPVSPGDVTVNAGNGQITVTTTLAPPIGWILNT